MRIGTGATLLLMAATAPAQGQPNAQQAFAAAEARAAANDWAGALADYDALAARVASPRTRAILSLKRGAALARLIRNEEAAAAYRQGLAALPANDASLSSLRVEALVWLAGQREQAFDFAGARDGYRAALAAAATTGEKLVAMGGLARAGIFVDPSAAAAEADRALAMVDPGAAGRPTRAAFLTLKGRALMNAGRAKEASAILSQAVEENGGMTARVDRADMAARSDKAIAAILAGDQETARRALAFTGAGHTRDGGIELGSEMQPPPCGPADDPDAPHPHDVTVIQFMVADDGAVRAVEPVYASRPGPMIVPFLRAASTWSWSPERLARIKPFFRSFVRVELRCSVASERPNPADLLRARYEEWVQAQGLGPLDERGRSAPDVLAAARAELARREAAGGAEARLLPPLVSLVQRSPDAEERDALAERARRIAAAAGAPIPVRAWLELFRSREMTGPRASDATRRRLIDRLLADPAYAGEARTVATLRLIRADMELADRDRRQARPMLEEIAGQGALGPNDPVKVAANIRLATILAAAGDLDAARTAYRRTGLDAMQCALVDARPAMRSLGLSSEDYPKEAMRWGFEGWAQAEFDVAPDGRTRNVRTVVAYPPFVFGDTTVKGIAQTRYTQTYRPEGGPGCGGASVRVSYALP